MTMSEQIALAAITYFEQVFVFCRLMNKNMLEWFLLIMCIEHTLSRSTNLLSRNHPTLCFLIKRRRSADVQYFALWLEAAVQNPLTSSWTVTLSTYGSIFLEFSRTVTSEINSEKNNRPVFIFINCLHK